MRVPTNVAEKYRDLKDKFYFEREEEYERQRVALVQKLEALIKGEDEDFLQQVEDLDEYRDLELVRIKNLRDFMMERAQVEFEEKMSNINERDEMAAKDIQTRLSKRLELRADMLDKNPNLDISAATTFTAPQFRHVPIGSRSRLRRREGGGAAGNASGTGGLDSTEFPPATGEELRSIFSDFGDFDAMSSGYTSNAPEASGGTSALTRQSTNKQPKLNPLKNDEIEMDLDAMKRRYW